MDEKQKNDGPVQRTLGLWVSGVFSALSLTFLIYSVYIVVIQQKGRFDLSDMVMMPVTALMVIASALGKRQTLVALDPPALSGGTKRIISE